MPKSTHTTTFLGGVQWFFFMFTNTIVIPLSVGAAFKLPQGEIAASMQRSFLFTGTACIIQAIFGHRRAIMEGLSGVWWGLILSLCATAPSVGISLNELGGSLAVGIILSGVIISLLGMTGLAQKLSAAFTPVVMSVYLLLFGSQITTIFFKGMLGLSQGSQSEINYPVAALSIVIAMLTAVISIKGSETVSRFAVFISIIIGWILYALIIPSEAMIVKGEGSLLHLFPWGKPAFNVGIILTAVMTGLVNTSTIFSSLKVTEPLYGETTSPQQYRSTFALSGLFSVVSGLFGIVPYGTYASSVGFLESTRILDRAPFILGAFIFLTLGFIPPLGDFFSTMPISIGNAVLFVAYLQMFGSALRNINKVAFNYKTIYRIALPIFLGLAIMNLQPEVFFSLPAYIRPLVSNGLLMGTIAALIIDNLIKWEKYHPIAASETT